MIKIPKPTIKAKDVFLDCISTVKNANTKREYTDCQNIIESAEKDFDDKFPLNKIYEIPQTLTILGNINRKEMEKVYDYRMVRPDMPGYRYYNIIKSLAPYGRCPLCSVREADTLDHYLPKSKYPIFSVTPINLVPACSSCNKGKRVSFPTNAAEQTLHPYYDNVQDESWIKAVVLRTNPISFDYFVDCPNSWQQIQVERATNHFFSFGINDLFSSHANEELRGAIVHLQKLFNLDPSILVEHLNEAYSSRTSLGVNSWQAIMYHSLLSDSWFITGGVLG